MKIYAVFPQWVATDYYDLDYAAIFTSKEEALFYDAEAQLDPDIESTKMIEYEVMR